MKNTKILALGKKLLPHLPGYSLKVPMLYATPLNHVLRGFCFEGSGIDSSVFYLWVFYLPLYIPANHVSFNFGKRLGEVGGTRWNLNEPGLEKELFATIQNNGLPFLAGVKEPIEVVMNIQKLCNPLGPNELEAIAFSYAMVGDVSAAKWNLTCLIKTLDKSIPWQAEMFDRSTQFSQTLASDPEKAKKQLLNWEHETVINLGLGRLPQSL